MSKPIKFLSALLAAGVLSCGFAVADEDMTLEQLVERYDEARGGSAAWKDVKDVRMVGKMKMGPMELPIALELARPAKSRMEMSIQGMTYLQTFDGSNGWAINPMTGKTDAEPLGEDELKMAMDQADLDGALIDWKTKGHKVELLGKEDYEGTPVYKLSITRKSGNVETQYIDAENFVPIGGAIKTKMQGQDMSVKTTIGDYKEVDGKMVPHSIISEMTGPMGAMRQEMTITEISFNNDLDAARFGKPEAAKPAAAQ